MPKKNNRHRNPPGLPAGRGGAGDLAPDEDIKSGRSLLLAPACAQVAPSAAKSTPPQPPGAFSDGPALQNESPRYAMRVAHLLEARASRAVLPRRIRSKQVQAAPEGLPVATMSAISEDNVDGSTFP